MKNVKPQSNKDLIERYSDQPTHLPREIRDSLEKRWGRQPVQLYAMTDLDEKLLLSRIWLLLGPERIAVIDDSNRDFKLMADLPISEIKSTRESHGLSCISLAFIGDGGKAPLTVVRYSHRQRRAVENIRFVVEQRIEGRDVAELREADDVYAKAVTHSIREAQASVAGNKMAVVWRLMSYLKPYKKRLTFGMSAAVVMTLASLLPAYFTGYIIDLISNEIGEKTGLQQGFDERESFSGLRLEFRTDDQLWAKRNGVETAVQVRSCFPWSDPSGYVSLRDEDEKEIALVERLCDLEADSRLAVEFALVRAGFVFEIESVESIKDDFEIRNWTVITRGNRRSFQTKLDDWPHKLPGGSILIRDVFGDLFHIRDMQALDVRSRKLLWAFIG